MKGKTKSVWVGWMAVALLPLVAGAASRNTTAPQTNQPNQQDQQVATSPEQPSPHQLKLEKAKDLVGAKIINDKGERLGTVADIVLTPNRDAINYVALSTGGTWGVAEKYFAVPWSQFGLETRDNEKVLVLKNVNRADLDQAPGFDKNHWPATASANWLGGAGSAERQTRDIDRYRSDAGSANPPVRLLAYQENRGIANQGDQGLFTAPPSGEYANPNGSRAMAAPSEGGQYAQAPAAEPGRGMMPDTRSAVPSTDIEHLRLSKLLGTKVENFQGEDLGKLDNAMVDVNQGKLAFGIVAMRHGFLGLNKDYVAVPWSALDISSEPGVAKLNANQDTLMALAFDADNFPNLEDPQYSRQLYDRFQATPYWEALGFVPGDTEHRDSAATRESYGAPSMMGHPGDAKTIRGTIESVGTYPLAGTNQEGLSLRLRTDDGKIMTVQVGPRPFLDRQSITFNPGEPVTVVGWPAKGGPENTYTASQIKIGDRTIDLRTKEGKPLWSSDPFGSPDESSSSGHSTGMAGHPGGVNNPPKY